MFNLIAYGDNCNTETQKKFTRKKPRRDPLFKPIKKHIAATSSGMS
jgi:hypothetical protein